MARHSIAIIGAGFSGTALALQLLRRTPADVVVHLIERSGRFGPGLAYGTAHDGHLLNVPAGRMSLFADRDGDFLDWLQARQESAAPGTFAPRREYANYLRDRLAQALCEDAAGRLDLVEDEVAGIEDKGPTLVLRLESGAALPVQAAVLAGGNLAPAAEGGPRGRRKGPRCSGRAHEDFHCPAAWDPAALEGLRADDPVLLVGTGLTMVDMVISLLDRGHTGQIHAISRRGLLAKSHPSPLAPAPAAHGLPVTLRDLVRRVRTDAAAAGDDWHRVIDGLRPSTQALWQGLTLAERQRFMRHVRPFWDVHRHRMAPAIAVRIAAATQRGQLQLHAGRVETLVEAGRTVIARVALRGGRQTLTLPVGRVVDCTGLAGDITQISDGLVRQLLQTGLARPDLMRLGLDVTDHGAVRGADGTARGRLFAVGPLTKGVLWEVIAVPDIRRQCDALARHLGNLATAQVRRTDVLERALS